MKSRVFNITTAISCLICAATIGGFIRSFWIYDCQSFRFFRRGTVTSAAYSLPSNNITELSLGSMRGGIFVCLSDVSGHDIQPVAMMAVTHLPARYYPHPYVFDPQAKGWELLGVCYVHMAYEQSSFGTTSRFHSVVVPYVVIILVFAALPIRWLIAFRRSRICRFRRLHKLCPRCGYDLRASPGSCPECGNRVVKRGRS